MKVIFLDFDGVLNNETTFSTHKTKLGSFIFKKLGVEKPNMGLDLYNMTNLKIFLESNPDVYIVISSTWRLLFTLSKLKKILRPFEIPIDRIIGETPNEARGFSLNGPREVEIKKYLEKYNKSKIGKLNPIDKFAILDDNAYDFKKDFEENFLQTDYFTGLTLRDVRKLNSYFRSNTPLN
jgi:hypothetical protein